LKNQLRNVGQKIWAFLTDVPGWPDAPKALRFRRLIPIAVPCVLLFGLFVWSQFFRAPERNAERATDLPLQALQVEVNQLQLACSDQQATELSAQATQAHGLCVEESALPPVLRSLKQQAVEKGWEATFVTVDRSEETPPPEAVVAYYPVRGKMAAKASGQAFENLVSFLEQIPRAPKRIDLMRLTVRADEQGRYAAELNLRFVRPVAGHEKTP